MLPGGKKNMGNLRNWILWSKRATESCWHDPVTSIGRLVMELVGWRGFDGRKGANLVSAIYRGFFLNLLSFVFFSRQKKKNCTFFVCSHFLGFVGNVTLIYLVCFQRTLLAQNKTTWMEKKVNWLLALMAWRCFSVEERFSSARCQLKI